MRRLTVKRYKRTFGGEGNVLYSDCGGGYTTECTCLNSSTFNVYLLLCTCRTVILLFMAPKSTCLKSAVISEERKIDLTSVKFPFCFKQFIKKNFMY